MIIGIWHRNEFLRYISIKVRNLSEGISDLMVTTHALYTIPESEIIYFTPIQPITQYQRLHPHQGNTNNTT